jgi:hypothetical protein
MGRAFDIHSLTQISSKEVGILNGLVSPEMAFHLEDTGIKTTGKADALACFLTVMVMCQELERNL